MSNQQILLPYVLIAFGALYILKPDIFHNLLTKRKAALERRPIPSGNKLFMRVLGTLFVVVGIVMLLYEKPR